MRCGGCGAKLASDPLRRVLQRLPTQSAPHVVLGIGDDAAEVRHGTGSTLLSVDGFRAMIDDPYLLGRICAHHSLNDLYAMGAQPASALALSNDSTYGGTHDGRGALPITIWGRGCS